jgi:hypothetical protein
MNYDMFSGQDSAVFQYPEAGIAHAPVPFRDNKGSGISSSLKILRDTAQNLSDIFFYFPDLMVNNTTMRSQAI